MTRAVRPVSGPDRSGPPRPGGGRHRLSCLLLLALLLGGGPLAAVGQTCGAAGGDNRPVENSDCDPAGPANHPSAEPATGTANSIDLVTGNKYLHETDYAWPDGLVLTRHYNSRNGYVRSLGVAWTHGFETTLVRVHRGRMRSPSKAVVELQVIQADGRRLVFRAVREPTRDRRVLRFRAVDPAYGSIIEQPDASPDRRYRWRWRSGRQLSFDADGRLSAIESPYGLSLSLSYQPVFGLLERVSARSGQALHFEYFGESDRVRGVPGAWPGRLAAVIQPDGTRVRYRYDDTGLLAEVLHPSGENSRFGYDDPMTPHAVTRWTDSGGRPRGEYRYDQQGRAVYSARAGGVEAVWLAYRLPESAGEPGETRVVDASGRTSLFTWRYLMRTHQAQILSASGEGCAACPPVGVRRRYDRAEQLVEESFGDGAVRIVRLHDRVGRLAELRMETKPAAFIRYRYAGDDPEAPLASLEYPSVAPGRVRSVRFEHDDAGRITAHVESGFTPDLRSLGRDLVPARWLPIERRSSYRWVRHGGAQGRLEAVDGPLAGDGDSTRHEYDQHGWLIATHRPEGLTDRFVRDRHGRVREWIDAAGIVQRNEYDATGSLSAIERGGLRTAIDYSRGVMNPSLSSPRFGVLHFSFDDAGRLASVADALGGRLQVGYDGDDRPVRTRISGWVDGVPTTILDAGPGGRPLPPNPVAWGSGSSRVRHTPDGRTSFTIAGHPRTIWLRDDFGRLVAQASIEHGVLVHRHDEAGRRIASADDRGIVVVRRYDSAGRLIAEGTPADPLKVQYRYRGPLLEWVSDPVQTTAYEYDRSGRVIAEGVVIGGRNAPSNRRAVFVTTRHFDRRGRLAGETFPDGHAIGYGYLENGLLSAIVARTPDRRLRVIASAIDWIPFAAPGRGLTGLTFGNSIRASYGHDRFGRIVSVEHRSAGAGIVDGLPRQQIRYDERGLIVGIDEPGRHFAYRHDDLGRLVAAGTATVAGVVDATGAVSHAGGGNATGSAGVASAGPLGLAVSIDYEGFAYDEYGNRVVTVAGDGTRTAGEPPMLHSRSQTAHRYDARGTLLADLPLAGRVADIRGARMIRTARGTAAARSSYAFNHAGERIRSIPASAPAGARYFIHSGGQLKAELDATGQLINGYIRIGDRPVAVIGSGAAPDPIRYLHSDHLATHRATTDQRSSIVQTVSYSAFGKPTIRAHEEPSDGSPPGLPGAALRRLGQFAEPGQSLHHNHRRWYDPEHGRFTTPDPLGVLAGNNPYAYAALDPVRLTDASGLYQTDVHFYMMYFLARVSGLSERTSLTIAQASQFVDDNPATEPLPNMTSPSSSIPAQPMRLGSYHITQLGRDPPRLPGETDDAYAMRRVLSPSNPQLAALLAYANLDLRTTANPAGVSPCARAQLFGEYLHVFADTFAHRNNRNEPIELNGGLGHLFHGGSPDYTFNHVANYYLPPLLPGGVSVVYALNEYRTLQMERAVMFEISRNFGTEAIGPNGLPLTFEDIRPTLDQFNAIPEADCRVGSCWPNKLALLDRALNDLGLGTLPAYSVDQARAARIRNLDGLDPARYPGAILMTR